MLILRWIITFQITALPNTLIPKAVRMYVMKKVSACLRGLPIEQARCPNALRFVRPRKLGVQTKI